MSGSSGQPWAQLVSTTENESDPVPIDKAVFVIGRSKDADLSLINNKLVSGKHCAIEKDEESCQVYLHDNSTNGTLVNFTKKVLHSRYKLRHGDEIHIVYRKSDPDKNVAYMYQDLEELRKEEEEDQSSEATQQYSISHDLDTTAENSDTTENLSDLGVTTKRKSQDVDVPSDQDFPESKKQKLSTEAEAECDQGVAIEGEKANTSGVVSSSVQQEVNTTEQKDKSLGNTDDGKASSEEPKKDKSSTDSSKPPEVDEFEESLICIICQEILHDCISCQPCMHSFCAGCYSDWMTRSHECPSCRGKVEKINKNFIINNLVEAYLKEHKDKRRPEEEIKALDARSKVIKNTMTLPKLKKTMSEIVDESDDDDELSNSNSDDSNPGGDGGIAPPPFGYTPLTARVGFGHFNLFPRPPKTVCRQCPEYKAAAGAPQVTPGTTVAALATRVVNTVMGRAQGTGDNTNVGTSQDTDQSSPEAGSSSTCAGAAQRANVANYKCRNTQIHILCQCCLQPMPDRRTEAQTNNAIPVQQCTLCYRMYCHLYWGCRNVNCSGCLFKFKDMALTQQSYRNLILDNVYESDIFKDYLESGGKTLNQVLAHCLEMLESGTYTCMDQARGLNSNTVLCYGCATRNLRELAYQYRRDIPKEELPAAVTNRPDCYWGKNCRTQRGRINHAAKFNHICEQTRS